MMRTHAFGNTIIATVVMAAFLVAGGSSAQPASGLGAIYPGAEVIQPVADQKCGKQYIFRTPATMKQVQDFYIAQAAAVGLSYNPDPKVKDDPKFRILIFGDGRRMLEVVLTAQEKATRVSVLYIDPPVGAPVCSK